MREMVEPLLENSQDIIMRFDREMRHLYVNSTIAQWLELSPADFLGKTHRELGFAEEDCVFYESVIATAFASGLPAEHEITVPTRGGKRVLNWRVIPELDAARQVKSVLGVARDITAHRMTEHDLRQLFIEMADGFALHEIICDRDGGPVDYRFLNVNPAFERLTGLSAAQVVGRRILEVLPETEPVWIESYGKVALTGEKMSFEHFSKGVGRHFEVKAYSPKPGQFACIFSDITEHKRIEESLLAFTELTSDYVHKCLRVGAEPYRAQWIGGATESVIGYGSEELLAMGCWLSLVHPDDRQTVSDHLMGLKPGDCKAIEFRVVGKDRRIRWISEKSRCLAGALDGELVLLGAVTDITGRKEAEAKEEQGQHLLRERQEFIKALINSTTEAIIGMDCEGSCIFINQAAQQILGYEPGEFIGQPVHTLLASRTDGGGTSTAGRDIIREVIASARPHRDSDGLFWTNAGGCIAVDYVVRPIVRKGQVYGAVVTFSDVGEKRKQMEQRIRSGQLAALGELATGMAHEINNPITGVINCAQLLQNRYARSDQETKILAMIIKEGNRISNIVSNLLVFAHRDRDAMAPLDIGSVIDESLLLTDQQLINDGIYCDVEKADNLPRLYGNRQRLEQVMLNLISNARYALNSKYPASDPNKILRISAREVVRQESRKIELTVYDQGCGIPEPLLEKVFNSFFTTKPAGEGTGLGLGIVHDILEEHGAAIHIESDFGHFTKVVVEFPVCDPAASG